MNFFTKGFMDRNSTKLSDKINEYSEKYNLQIVSINTMVTNIDAPIIEAIVLFSKNDTNIN